jgi:hypothetical protein
VVDGERPIKVCPYDLGFFSLKLNPSAISDFFGSKILKGLLNKENPIINLIPIKQKVGGAMENRVDLVNDCRFTIIQQIKGGKRDEKSNNGRIHYIHSLKY